MTTAGPPLIVVAGATGTGKTRLAIDLALAIRAQGRVAEVISADSRQVFRGLNIGTAKVTGAERDLVFHHGLDLIDPDTAFSVADFVQHASAALATLAARDGVAILAGGTGLYLRAIARGIDTDALPSDQQVRSALEHEFETAGLHALVERLIAVAPTRAAAVDRRNPRRVIRALEIAELQGDAPIPRLRGYDGPSLWLGLAVDAETLKPRLAARARAQFDGGLIEEARELRERFDPGLPAFSAIGYRESWAVLDGTLDREAAADLDAQRNWAFAKRQRTWFRAERDITWLDATEGSPLPAALAATDRLIGS